MVAERLSVSLSAESAAAVRKAASDAGMSVSGWVEQTVGGIARRQAGLRAMDDYEAEHGVFTDEEREQARDAGALIAAERVRREFLAMHRECLAAEIDPIVPDVVLAQVWRGRQHCRGVPPARPRPSSR